MGHLQRRLLVLAAVAAACALAPPVALGLTRDASRPPVGPAAVTIKPANDRKDAAAKALGARDRLIVRYRTAVTVAAARAEAVELGARLVKSLGEIRGESLVVLQTPEGSMTALRRSLAADPRVASTERDRVVHAFATPDDPLYPSQWALAQVSAPAAWDVSTGSSSVIVADLDSGVDYDHPDLAGAMWHNPGETAGNGIDDDGNGYVDDVYGIDRSSGDSDPMDEEGHGTFTAGIMAAVGDNTVGVTGVAWTARIMALRFLDDEGYGYTSDAVACINYAVAEKALGQNVAVINASFGGSGYSQSMHDAVQAAGAAGVVVVAAAGNSGTDNDATPSYPASFDCSNLVAVASTDRFDVLDSWSNYGATSVDLAAPGDGVTSTLPFSLYDAYYGTGSGTSFAAPQVSGAIALCAATYPSDTVAQRIARVLNHTDPAPGLAGKCVTGGRLDLVAALSGAAPGDDALPGVTLGPSPRKGTLDAVFDPVDIYHVFVKSGEEVTLTLTGPAGSDFTAYLFAPGTTDVTDTGAALAHTAGTSYPRTVTYTATATGSYSVVVSTASGSGDYQLDYSVIDDDDIPGRPAAASPLTGTLTAGNDTDDVFAFRLQRGQELDVSLAGADGTDFRLLLFDPWAESIFDDEPLLAADLTAYPRTLAYRAVETGTYYLDVWDYSGSGSYSVTYQVKPAEADDTLPGVLLPASPMFASISPAGDWDVYHMNLKAGVMAQFTISGPPDSEFDLYLYAPGTTDLETATPVDAAYPDYSQATLDYLPPVSGEYYLVVDGAYGTGTYAIAHNIDTTPPTATVVGADSLWHQAPVALAFAANDTGSGVAYVEYGIDGAAFVQGFACVVSGDGDHTVTYRAVDNAGNVQDPQSVHVLVDGGPPVPAALGNATVRAGKKAALRFRVSDVEPQVVCVIKVYKKARLVKTLKLGLRTTNVAVAYPWTCRLAKGKYTWKVYATDLAGNAQSKPAAKTLTVK